MKKLVHLFGLLLCFHIHGQSQEQFMSTEYLMKLDKVIASPHVNAFQKYAYYPVSPSTGTTNIQIPVFTVKQGELTHDISFDYHTGGIKVNDASTPVGLGWLLNAGGIISRSQQGAREDEDNMNGYLIKKNSIPTQSYLNTIRSSSEYSQERKDFFYFCKNIVGTQNQTLRGPGIDLEPDLFSYNFQGRSGVFYFSNSGKIVTENIEALKINYMPNNGFQITDERGIIYLFEGKQQTSYKSNNQTNLLSGHNLYLFHNSSGTLPSDASQLLSGNIGFWYYLGNNTVPYPATSSNPSTSAWYLTRIIHPNSQDTIHFEYKHINYTSQQYFMQNKEVVYGHMSLNHSNTPYDINLIENSFYNEIADCLLTKIRYKSGEVVFSYVQDRIDSNCKDRLFSITCKNKNGENAFIIELDNNKYFSANFGTYNSDNKVNKRLKLEKILFKNNSNTLSNTYEFGYNETSLPPINSKSVDYWGYFNGKNNTSLIPKITIKDKGVTYGNANRTADENCMKAFILEKIIYPGKGMALIDYSCHKVHNSHSKIYVTNVGGLRINEMRLYPNFQDMSDYTVKKFEYSYNGASGIGRNISNVGAEFNFQFMNRFGNKGEVYTKSFVINSWPVNTINLPDFSNAVYDKVIETDMSMTGENLGRKETIFDMGALPDVFYDSYTSGDLVLLNIYDYYDPEKLTFRAQNSYANAFFVPVKTFYPLRSRPYLLKETIYNNNNLKIQETIKEYSIRTDEIEHVKGFYVSSYNEYVESNAGGNEDMYYYPFKYYYFLYEIPIQKRELISRSDFSLTANGTLHTKTTFEYDNVNGLLRKSTFKNSDGKTISQENWYPFDYSPAIPVIGVLKNKHILTPPIMQLKRSDEKIVEGIITELNEYAEPITFFTKKNSSIDIVFNPNTIIQVAEFLKETEIKNINGRIVEKKLKDDIPVVYLWSYSNEYPIAEIENASYSHVETALGGANAVAAFANKVSPSIGEIKTFLAPLSNNSNTKNALINYYTYKPLIGMTSKTEPNGITTFYEYDSFGRLQYIKDHNGKIIEKYDYHYKQ
ncbi:hypothetical protein [Proteiniphilum sp.]|uniref:hypothetical protein n=1 Tax=Proteiniphilum sp. TaxID=1926877 RepID=UPI002B1F206E|nr:hypothetical protein [Proteiniphilum sp.]MEA4918881.1 hypothetical protein [Proteiniphilum sp.]